MERMYRKNFKKYTTCNLSKLRVLRKGTDRPYLSLLLSFMLEGLVWFGTFLQFLAGQNSLPGGIKLSVEAGGCQLRSRFEG